MSVMRERIQELAAQHGSIRAAARALQVDAAYLVRLRDGEKNNPGEALLRRMGLRRVVTVSYVRTPDGAAKSGTEQHYPGRGGRGNKT